MIILSKQERISLPNRLSRFLPDFIIIFVISLFTGRPMMTFMILSLLTILIYIAAALKNYAAGWFMSRGKTQQNLAQTIFNDLQSDGYPEPPDIIGSATEYMYNIYKNPAYPMDLRIDAAYQSGSLAALASHGMIHEYKKTCLALEEALVMHKATFQHNKEQSK